MVYRKRIGCCFSAGIWRIMVEIGSPLDCHSGTPRTHGNICHHALSPLTCRGLSGTTIPICALGLLWVVRGIVVNFVQSR